MSQEKRAEALKVYTINIQMWLSQACMKEGIRPTFCSLPDDITREVLEYADSITAAERFISKNPGKKELTMKAFLEYCREFVELKSEFES